MKHIVYPLPQFVVEFLQKNVHLLKNMALSTSHIINNFKTEYKIFMI